MSSLSTATRRTRAGILMLAAFFVLAAGIVPACGSFCCAREAADSMHAAMPCCESQPKLERAQVLRMPQATSVSLPAAHVAAPVTAPASPPARALTLAALPGMHEPSPPLFLRNAQLLI
ncbi:MAG TPA: hypothetical protein VGF28_05175 [Thermoanaerobaculia bacterium]